MARTIRNQKLDSRSARSKLAVKSSPYWAPLSRGFAIGYRKGLKGGVWLVKLVTTDFRKEATLGPADDLLDPDGATIFSYADAQRRAHAWYAEMVSPITMEATSIARYTVGEALDDYLAAYRSGHTKGGGKAEKDLVTRIETFIRPAFGTVCVLDLTATEIRDWLERMSKTPARLRTPLGAVRKDRVTDPNDSEAIRKRRATANRTLTVLKAALNHAFAEGRAATDGAWRRVKPFREADSAKVRYLSADESLRLVNATDTEFRPMVQAALATGCRYGELASMRVADFDRESRTVTVRASKSGKARHVILAADGFRLFNAATFGKPGEALVFSRPGGDAWGKSHQHRRIREASDGASINPAVSFHDLRHTYATALLRAGVALPIIAGSLGHADTRMTSRHYAHLVPDHAAKMIRAAMPDTAAKKRGSRWNHRYKVSPLLTG